MGLARVFGKPEGMSLEVLIIIHLSGTIRQALPMAYALSVSLHHRLTIVAAWQAIGG